MKYLIPLLFPLTVLADTTGNLISNGTFDNGSTGWTTSGDGRVIGDCCPGGHDYEFGDMGSIEQDFKLYSETITQPMLNNGITLDSTTEWQNGEGGAGGWAPNRGGADTFTVRLQIKDDQGNVLATTTQVRTDTTGINGVNFTDTLTYTGTGSRVGNIYLSGADANAPANLGGPNVDNISVTMTYDPTVLTAQQTQEITAIFEELEEVLVANVETVEFEPIEEITFEPLSFEEPEMIIETFKEIFIEELAKEEINVGIVNVFTLPPPEELAEIPTEVSYGGQENIQEISTEIESFEEIIETRENQSVEEFAETRPEPTEERTELVGGNEPESTESEGRVSRESEITNREQPTEQVAEETETNPEPTETESAIVAEEEVNDETVGETETSPSDERSETTEVADASAENDQSTPEAVEESGSGETSRGDTPTISVESIEKKVNELVKRIDQRLVATSVIVAKAMQSSFSVDNYGKVNEGIFNQPNIDGGDYYETRNYIDTRNIYAQNQNVYNDAVTQYQENVQDKVDARIRAEEHLRRIRGY